MKRKESTNKTLHLQVCILSFLTLLALSNAPASGLQQQTENASTGSAMSVEIKELLTIVRDEQLRESDNERVVIAIRRLGEMKAALAIDDLLHLLTFKRRLGGVMREGGAVIYFQSETVFGRYPAADALYRIGKPSLPALIKVIEAEQSGSLASENALYTFAQIFRDAPSEGVNYLSEAAAKTSLPQAAQKLSQAIEKLKRSTQH